MAVEYSAYGPYSTLVANMVNYDIPEHVIAHFYTQLSGPKIGVEYIPNFNDAQQALQFQDTAIVTTLINLCQGGGEPHPHALTFVKNQDDVYLFDPNGAVDASCNSTYVYAGQMVTIYELAEILKYDYGLDIHFQTAHGVQYYAPRDTNSPFINQGGYCMFYNYCFIEFITTHWNDGKNMIIEIITHLHINYSGGCTGIFPSNLVLPYYTLGVIYHAFRA